MHVRVLYKVSKKVVLYSREVSSLQRLKSMVQALLGHDQVVFIERWSLDTSGL